MSTHEVYAIYLKVRGGDLKLEMLCASESVADREVFAITDATSQHAPQQLRWTSVDQDYMDFVRERDRVPGKVVTCWETNQVPTIRVYITRMAVKQGEAINRLADVFNAF